MQLKLFRHLWGIDQPWAECFPRIAAEGFTGIESPLPPPGKAREFRSLLDEHRFEFIGMIFTNGNTVAEHVASFREQVGQAVRAGATRITAHSGKDAFSTTESTHYFREAVEIARDTPVPIGHETHRGRILFNPWITRHLLEAHSELKLVADFSHWVCVAERLLGDCQPIIDLAASRTIHLHARVGYEQGPQVPDPSAPEYRAHFDAHMAWWKTIWSAHQRAGFETSTVTPEFGPPGYLHTLPHTNLPVADLWRVCDFMAKRLRESFASV